MLYTAVYVCCICLAQCADVFALYYAQLYLPCSMRCCIYLVVCADVFALVVLYTFVSLVLCDDVFALY